MRVLQVGVFALTATLLFAAKAAIIDKKPTLLSTALGFLHRDLKPHFYW